MRANYHRVFLYTWSIISVDHTAVCGRWILTVGMVDEKNKNILHVQFRLHQFLIHQNPLLIYGFYNPQKHKVFQYFCCKASTTGARGVVAGVTETHAQNYIPKLPIHRHGAAWLVTAASMSVADNMLRRHWIQGWNASPMMVSEQTAKCSGSL